MCLFKGESLLVLGGAFDTLIDASTLVSFEKLATINSFLRLTATRYSFSSPHRVNSAEWLGKKGSWDMSYEGTFGDAGYGAKAQEVLGQVRGARFQHEKNKRKRSYFGGAIDDSAVNSIKFQSDSE